MSYATVAQLRVMLSNLPAGAATDADLQDYLDRATDRIDLKLGFSFAAYGAGAAKDVRTPDYITDTWAIPEHEVAAVSTVTVVARLYSKGTTGESTETVTDWEELEDGRLYRYSGWEPGAWYRITAKWGHDTAPAAVVQLCLEAARDMWFQKDASASSNTVGIEGAGAVRTQWAWTSQQYETLMALRLEHGEFGIA